MAFNFNWSPLIADTSRARDMLTTALNKSPKPPIIVDDIIVTELNLGSVPPELEILEIGDLAEDRFRGIFKMSYTGDAYLTLKTRVQANPLNTYLSAKPLFASPQPLAASSGLTIPLQLTLSDIRLSGFVILVFSRQKGLTLVFRNDPLESLKVSSTFDSIPFVRDYLQKEIEKQLRVLFMEDLPAIIHRLSLHLWSPEHTTAETGSDLSQDENAKTDKHPVDPLASPPLDACDAFGRRLDDTELSSLSLDNGAETHATFSQKNLLRLATLNDSHRTLALFTPTIRDAVFRAWAGAAERGDAGTCTPSYGLSAISRQQPLTGSTTSSAYSFSDAGSAVPSRPSTLSSLHSTYGSTYMAATGRSKANAHATRQRKNRVVNLRREPVPALHAPPNNSSRSSTPTPSLTMSSQGATGSSEEREGELVTPPSSPVQRKARVRIEPEPTEIYSPRPHTPAKQRFAEPLDADDRRQSNSSFTSAGAPQVPVTLRPAGPKRRRNPGQLHIPQLQVHFNKKAGSHQETLAHSRFPPSTPYLNNSPQSTGGILEQAWMVKMAAEIAKKVKSEKEAAVAAAAGGFWGLDGNRQAEDENPPPAYAA